MPPELALYTMFDHWLDSPDPGPERLPADRVRLGTDWSALLTNLACLDDLRLYDDDGQAIAILRPPASVTPDAARIWNTLINALID